MSIAPKTEATYPLLIYPITIELVKLNDNTYLIFDPPLFLIPKPTESGSNITVEYPDLGIDAIASTMEELIDELKAVIIHLWKYCVKEEDEKLGSLLVKTKRNLQDAIKEVSYDNA